MTTNIDDLTCGTCSHFDKGVGYCTLTGDAKSAEDSGCSSHPQYEDDDEEAEWGNGKDDEG